MKKDLIIIVLILLIITVICIVGISTNIKKKEVYKIENKEYEQYLLNEIYGTEVITLINKAISDNEKNMVEKDEKGIYIPNNTNSITIDIVLITNETTKTTTTYKMETISKIGISQFVKNFNTAKFKCTKKEYHKQTGKVKHIEITQQTI